MSLAILSLALELCSMKTKQRVHLYFMRTLKRTMRTQFAAHKLFAYLRSPDSTIFGWLENAHVMAQGPRNI